MTTLTYIVAGVITSIRLITKKSRGSEKHKEKRDDSCNRFGTRENGNA
jgi:hypothetical protein